MKLILLLLFTGCLLAATTLSVAAQSAPAKQAPTDKGWPRTFTNGAASFAVYQPQIEAWKDNKFEARAAVAVTTAQSKQPAYGVVWFAARTEVDKAARLVTLSDCVITKV